MKHNNTAKFGLNNDFIIEKVKTEITENAANSHLSAQGNESHMNVSELEFNKDDSFLINHTHKILGEKIPVYQCPICDRLRSICPYKSSKAYQYCHNCMKKYEKKPQTKIYDSIQHSLSKNLASTFNDTKGYAKRQEFGNKNLKEVNKVRFVETDKVYLLDPPPQSQYKEINTSNPLSKGQIFEKRAHSSSELRQLPYYNHQVLQEKIVNLPNFEEIIFYPVIHNRFVYKPEERENNFNQISLLEKMGRSRYQSHHIKKKEMRDTGKVITDFLNTTVENEVLTPFQFKQLANSIYREKSPNIEEN